MHVVLRRAFEEYPLYQRLRLARKIGKLRRRNPTLFRHAMDRRSAREAVRYWRSYGLWLNLSWHRAYSAVCPVSDPQRYIPEDVFYAYIERAMNRHDLAEAYTDKNGYDRLFRGARTLSVLLRAMNHRYYGAQYNALQPADAAALLRDAEGDFIIKPSIASGDGLNVRKLTLDRGTIWLDMRKTSLPELETMYGGDFLVQPCFVQHPAIAEFHPHSVNTIRFFTVRIDREVAVASAVLRLGDRGRYVDNGGIPCGITPRGQLNNHAMTKYFVKHDVHPVTEKPFQGFVVPGWENACTMVRRLHEQLPYFDLVSWDITIGRDSLPCLVEMNLRYQEINFLQVNNGPLFGDRTEEVLTRVFRTERKMRRDQIGPLESQPTSGAQQPDLATVT
jgi:hypothetical protein